MWRALAKGAAQAAFGGVPGGARLYRRLTREVMGTQATHVDKLARVWPGYARLWQERGVKLAGARLWVHEGGWTPFPFVAGHLLTGTGVTVTNVEGQLLDRHCAGAVSGALATSFPEGVVPDQRQHSLEALRWAESVLDVVRVTGGTLHQPVDPARLPLASSSIDLCHSGGTLEHYPPARLAAFLVECWRVLRPGGVASHVVDHRDHLHHADARWPFLAHLAVPEWLYRPLYGHALGYHSRLRPAEIVALFEAAGFERICVRRMVLPERRWIDDGLPVTGAPGLPRALLAPRFRELSDDDLRTAAAHYLFRRPISAGAVLSAPAPAAPPPGSARPGSAPPASC
jgi:SAM-dependent methyltransferase